MLGNMKSVLALSMKTLNQNFLKLMALTILDNPCKQATDCSECMKTDPRCGWCLDTVSL